MWFNGTSLSEKARRALENEKVTIVSHISGYIHTIYPEATIDRTAYDHFSERLNEFLHTDLTSNIFINFLRFKSKYKTLFQFECKCPGKTRYVTLEKMFEYEHNSKFNASPETREQLICEIEGDEFHLSPLPGKIMLNDAEAIINANLNKGLEVIESLMVKANKHIHPETLHEMFADISSFISTDPKLPVALKNFSKPVVPDITVDDTREEIVSKILETAPGSELSRLAIYAARLMDKTSWLPFVKAAIERNPVCYNDLNGKSVDEVFTLISELGNKSIYEGNRLALPDEVWNFRRGDGIEKALLLADFLIHRNKSENIVVDIDHKKISFNYKNKEFQFTSDKKLKKKIEISGYNYIIS
jgi:hypothetical protein